MKYTIEMMMLAHGMKIEAANDWAAWYCAQMVM